MGGQHIRLAWGPPRYPSADVVVPLSRRLLVFIPNDQRTCILQREVELFSKSSGFQV